MPPTSTRFKLVLELLADVDRRMGLRLATALLVVCAGALLTALAPLALQRMVDALVHAGGQAQSIPIWACAAIYVLVLGTGRLLGELRPALMGTAEQRLHTRLSRRFLAHVLDLPAAFHLDRRHGTLPQSLGQASAAARLVMNSLLQSLPTAIELITVIVVLAQLEQPALVGIFVASAAAYAMVFHRGMRRISQHGKAVSQRSIEASAALTDALANIETIKCFTATEGANGRFAAATDGLELSWVELHRQRTRLGLGVAAVFSSSIAAAVFVAMAAVQQDELSLGGFVLATVYMLQMVRPIETLGAAARDIGQAIEFASPALEILRLPVETGTKDQPAVATAACPRAATLDLQLSNLRLAYPGGPQVLHDLSLHVPAGTSLAIVGPSGSGKSSLARLILRLVDPDAGHILFGNVPGSALDPAEVRAMIGCVQQDIVLFDDTVAMNVGIGRPRATRADIEAACRVARVHDFVLSLPAGYDTRVGPRGLHLSGGERQRIGIARAILKQPGIYLFDEATSALDGSTEAEILRDLRRICAGCTTLFITHRIAAARWADRVAVLRNGRIVDIGTHAELLQRDGSYARSFHLQAGAFLHERHAARSSRSA